MLLCSLWSKGFFHTPNPLVNEHGNGTVYPNLKMYSLLNMGDFPASYVSWTWRVPQQKMGGFLKWWCPQSPPQVLNIFLVGKPHGCLLGFPHHFRNPPPHHFLPPQKIPPQKKHPAYQLSTFFGLILTKWMCTAGEVPRNFTKYPSWN